MDSISKELKELYEKHKSIYKVAEIVGLSPQYVHERLSILGVEMCGSGKKWTTEESIELIKLYKNGFTRGDGALDEFCKRNKRTKQFACRMAKKLGLTNAKRAVSKEQSFKTGKKIKEHIKKNGHPRGMRGKNHTAETKKIISDKSKQMWAKDRERLTHEIPLKSLKTKWGKGTLMRPRNNTSWKSGWYEVGEKKIYFRSSWEYNYSLILEKYLVKGKIAKWDYEPDIFWFENIKRGVRSYCPDFKVTLSNGEIEYHEVKGWMDAKSKTKLKRMKKYYPDIKIVIVDAPVYKKAVKYGVLPLLS